MIHPLRVMVAAACIFAYTAVSAAQPNTSPSKVEVTPEHVLSINGKKIFTIGFTVPPAPDARVPNGKLALEEFRDAGAVFIRTGPMRNAEGAASGWNDEWIARERQYMDAAARAGMYCLPWLKEFSAIEKGQPKREEKLRQIIRLFKDHPGLAAWKGEDEPQWGKKPGQTHEVCKF